MWFVNRGTDRTRDTPGVWGPSDVGHVPRRDPILMSDKRYKVGAPLPNRDKYPHLGEWWVQIWDIPNDKVLCRVYGDNSDGAHETAVKIANHLNETS